MNSLPIVTDAIALAIANLVDDAQDGRRDPSHSDIEYCIDRAGLRDRDPKAHGRTYGKAKRVRAVFAWALESAPDKARLFAAHLLDMIRAHGGFREGSPNYVGSEAIKNLRDALAGEGLALLPDGRVQSRVLDNLSGQELTDALWAYVRRAQQGSDDAALLAGTAKDLLEATASHVLTELGLPPNRPENFPTLLGQAFVALGLRTSHQDTKPGEPPECRLERALYDAALAVNTLRNKEGTGHGRAWLPTLTEDAARTAIQTMAVVAEMLLAALRRNRP